jgi:Tfp pilus assembly protein PilN
MPQVNLIRSCREEERRAVCVTRQLYIALLVVFALAVLGNSILAGRTAAVRGEIRACAADITAQRPTLEKIESCRNEEAALKPKLSLLADCREETLSWHAICCSLSRRISPEIWLTGLDIEDSRANGLMGGKMLKINGVAFSHAGVGRTMMGLSRIPEFESVDLESTQRVELEGEQLLSFRLVAQLPQRQIGVAPQSGRTASRGAGTAQSSG